MNKNDVGSSAGQIWRLLAERGNMSIRKIGEMTHCKESVIFLALGWLARENKVRFCSDGTICRSKYSANRDVLLIGRG